jgi:predicted MFS family arabinose efflux permease
VRALAYGLYAFCDDLPEFLFAELIDAIGTTLASGALDAWAVDGMREEGDHAPKDRFFARALVLARTLMVASGIVGGYLATADLMLPWFAGTATFVLTGTVAVLFMRETRQDAGASTHRPTLRETVRTSFAAVHESPALGFLCLATFFGSFAMMSAQQLWQPHLMALGGGEVWVLGWIWALLSLSSLVGSLLVPRLLAHASRATVLGAASAWRAVTLGGAAQAGSFSPAAAGFLLQEVGFGLGEPVVSSWMNEHAASRERATVLSIRSMSFTLGGSLGALCMGFVAHADGIPAAWTIAAAIHGLVAVGVLTIGRRIAGGVVRAAGPSEAAPVVRATP